MGAVCVRRYRTQTVQIFDYLYTKRTMDKFGWQRPMIPNGMTGIQKACAVKKADYKMKKTMMIADAINMAKAMER